MRATFICALLSCSLLLSGCVGALTWNPHRRKSVPPGSRYTVQRGDTLYSIAFHYGLDYHDLASSNAIKAPYFIYPGERLKLAPQPSTQPAVAATRPYKPAAAVPKTAPASKTNRSGDSAAVPAATSKSTHWAWPVQGPLLSSFEQDSPLAKGIDIGGHVGEAIRAAASGKVVYTGSGLIGYGKLIIIKHDTRHLSAYAYNEQVFVTQGEEVKQGDRVALMGKNRNNHAMLHFEIRYQGKPVNPLHYLPKHGSH